MTEDQSLSPPSNQQESHPAAMIIGATGAVGRYVVQELMHSDFWGTILSVGRRQGDNTYFPNNEKHCQVVVPDLGQMDQPDQGFLEAVERHQPQVAFVCLGTTRSAAGSDEAFRKVDYDYVVKFAQIARDHNVSQIHVVSSMGASPHSWFLYLRTKGQMEQAIEKMQFKQTFIYRPGLLGRDSPRLVEKICSWFQSVLPCPLFSCVMVTLAQQAFHKKYETTSTTSVHLEHWNNQRIRDFSRNQKITPISQQTKAGGI